MIVLVGFMGSGKTTVGLLLAEQMGLPFVDLDDRIEKRVGLTVAEIFASRGEEEFRRVERLELAATLDGPDAVIAAGGGALATDDSEDLIRDRALTVWLNAPFELIEQRLEGDRKRPLFADRSRARALFVERLPAYKRSDLEVEVRADDRPMELALRIQRALREVRCAI